MLAFSPTSGTSIIGPTALPKTHALPGTIFTQQLPCSWLERFYPLRSVTIAPKDPSYIAPEIKYLLKISSILIQFHLPCSPATTNFCDNKLEITMLLSPPGRQRQR